MPLDLIQCGLIGNLQTNIIVHAVSVKLSRPGGVEGGGGSGWHWGWRKKYLHMKELRVVIRKPVASL